MILSRAGEISVVRKHAHHAPSYAPLELNTRVRKAESEGRFQQALELAKQLYKHEPTPAHLEMLKRVYLGRAAQLNAQRYSRDAATVLEAALRLDEGNSSWVESIAEGLAASGQPRRALDLIADIPNCTIAPRLLANLVDQSLQQGKTGRDTLPESMRGQFDRVREAFALLEAGQDEPARAALQEIGLQSPFLEWKLLLRGLAAYYHNDDVRALENWQRLSADRLPARLAASLRFGIDHQYRDAQPPKVQEALQRQADRLLEAGPYQNLRALQKALAGEQQLPHAFRLAENILPVLRQAQPHLVPRLASCFYWAIVHAGHPEDMNRYRRVFGEPADDPHFNRLQALVNDHQHDFDNAHKFWQDYEKEVAQNPAFPGTQATRVRALIWSHMGKNAACILDDEKLAQLPKFLRDHPDRPRALVPTAEECFRRSMELAPDQLEPYQELFRYYQHADHRQKAQKVGRRLLEHFPEHVATLEALADMSFERHDYPEALALLQRALQVNPLDRGLRAKMSNTHLYNARSHAEQRRYDQARAEYQTCLALDEKNAEAVLCKWAACEFKASVPTRAEELLQQARARGGAAAGMALHMVIEAIRLKLPRPLKKRFDNEFAAALAAPPSAQAAADLIGIMGSYRAARISYTGQKTHEKKVLAYLDKARAGTQFTEEQLFGVCTGLLELGAQKPLEAFAKVGRSRFPDNPHFPFLAAEICFRKRPNQLRHWKVRPLLEEAQRLAAKLPPDEDRQTLLEAIQERQQIIEALNPFGGLFQGMMNNMFEEPDEFLEDEWEEDFDEPPSNPFGGFGGRRRGRR
jgi:tetratricopeptide (TPR) repeat protein